MRTLIYLVTRKELKVLYEFYLFTTKTEDSCLKKIVSKILKLKLYYSLIITVYTIFLLNRM